MKRKIDMYNKSRRERNTRLCILYAKKRATQFLGAGAWHQCDESCAHDYACKHCKHCIDEHDEMWFGTEANCALANR